MRPSAASARFQRVPGFPHHHNLGTGIGLRFYQHGIHVRSGLESGCEGLDSLGTSRRPLCKPCLDWSARRSHLAGSLGQALLDRFYQLGWARRVEGTRVVAFTKQGEAAFQAAFPGS